MRNAGFAVLARLSLAGSLIGLAACAKDKDITVTNTPGQVTFTQASLYPEGTQYDDANGRFLVSSQTAGRIGQVRDDGSYAQFADDPQLISTIGLNLDVPRNRLLVAVSDPGYNTARTTAATLRKLAAVAIFNAAGAKTNFTNLGILRTNYAAHFANDLTVDNVGNIYVTDSYAPIIYKIDTQGVASVFLENSALAAPAGTFGLNGIVYHPDGFLIVAKSDEGALLKVPLSSPGSFSKIVLATGLNLSGDDGLQLIDTKTLLVACNAQGQVYRLTSADGFGNVARTGSFATGAVYPTTLARRNGADSYVLYSYLNALQAMQTPAVSQFSVTKVTF